MLYPHRRSFFLFRALRIKQITPKISATSISECNHLPSHLLTIGAQSAFCPNSPLTGLHRQEFPKNGSPSERQTSCATQMYHAIHAERCGGVEGHSGNGRGIFFMARDPAPNVRSWLRALPAALSPQRKVYPTSLRRSDRQ